MSILSWYLKSKKEMAKTNTKYVRIWKYTVTSHAQNRTVDKTRKLKKSDMVNNLLTRPCATTPVIIDKFGRPSYKRIGKTAITAINPINNNVCSIKPTNDRDAKKYNLEKKGRNYVKKKETRNSRRKKG